MLLEARGDGPEMLELIEEALDEIAEAVRNELKAGMLMRRGIGLTLAKAPRSARVLRKASLS